MIPCRPDEPDSKPCPISEESAVIGRKQKTPSKSITWGLLLAALSGLCTRSHIVDHHLTESGATDLRCTVHRTGKVISDFLALDRAFHRLDDGISRFKPAHVTQHHFCRQYFRTRVHVIFTGVLGCGAVGCLKAGHRI